MSSGINMGEKSYSYDAENKRIIQFGKIATPHYWDEFWDLDNLEYVIKNDKDNKFILNILKKYVKKKGKILEGGCGRGQVVYCMYYHNYDVIGIDFAKNTVSNVKKTVPEVDVRYGDVRDLPFPDNFFKAYWSLGVIEHFKEGYMDALDEMYRVLDEDGYLFLTFPYISPLRLLKIKLGQYKPFYNNYIDFYQFIFDPKIVISDFNKKGFILVEKYPIDGIKGLKDEIRFFELILQRIYDYSGNNTFLNSIKFVLDKLLVKLSGHIIFLVLKKN